MFRYMYFKYNKKTRFSIHYIHRDIEGYVLQVKEYNIKYKVRFKLDDLTPTLN